MLIIRDDKNIKFARSTVHHNFDPTELYRNMDVLRHGEVITDFVEATDAVFALELLKIRDEDRENVVVYWDIANGRLMVVKCRDCDLKQLPNDYYFMRQVGITVIKNLRLEHRKALAQEWQKTLKGYIELIDDELFVHHERWEEEMANQVPEPHNIDDILQECYENQLFGD